MAGSGLVMTRRMAVTMLRPRKLLLHQRPAAAAAHDLPVAQIVASPDGARGSMLLSKLPVTPANVGAATVMARLTVLGCELPVPKIRRPGVTRHSGLVVRAGGMTLAHVDPAMARP